MWVLTLTDRNGRTVYLSKERWRHIQEYEELSLSIEEITSTLAYPTAITISPIDDRSRYYRYNKKLKQYVLVVVNYINLEGFIITGHYTNKVK